MRSLHDPWALGGLTIPNRVMLAPLAGIGNWFVRLQAKRYGAGLAVSEMISSFAIHYGNEKTLKELLVVHPDEGPMAIQLFGHDPDVMRSAAAEVARVGASILDLNMGCPVPKVMKTGAGAAMIKDPDPRSRSRAPPARAPACPSPSSCARRSSRAGSRGSSWRGGSSTRPAWPGSRSTRAARRSATRACRTTTWPRELVEELPVPVIVSGGMEGAEHIRWVFEHTGCAAVMLARGALGNPWLFAQVLGERERGAERRRGARGVALGDRPGRGAPRVPTGPRGICESSIRGTWSASALPRRYRTRSSAQRPWLNSATCCCYPARPSRLSRRRSRSA